MKKYTRFLSLVLVIVLSFTISGCRKSKKYVSYYLSDENPGGVKTSQNQNTDSDDKNKDTNDLKNNNNNIGSSNKNKNGKDTVVVAVNSNRNADIAPLFDALYKQYLDINIKIDYYSAKDDKASQEYIAAKSSTGQLPDVVFDDIANLSLYVGQGLVYPLNKYIEKDPEYKFVPSSIMDNYTYGGQVYALPHQAYFTCLTLNTDILNDLGMNPPRLDWNFKDMIDFAKKVSNDKNCFAERLFYLDYYAAGSFSPNSSVCGYNIKTKSYDMTNSFAKAMNIFRTLRETANVEAWSLRLTKQYQSRFGSLDEWGATKLGRTVMMDFEKGTYSFAPKSEYTKVLKNSNWIYHPFPQEIKGRMPVHIDHAWMLANTRVPDSAFKVLSFLTYSTKGNLARLKAYSDAAKGKSKYKLNLEFYTPVTLQPDVVAAAKELFKNDEAQMYMYNNIGNCFRGDLDKFVPSWGQHWADVINPVAMKVQDGLINPDSTCKDLQVKATKSIQGYWNDFDIKLKKVQAEWNAKH